MNYIQRLFDSAASAPPATMVVPLIAAGHPSASPVLEADQRLGIFPELTSAFPALSESPDVADKAPAPQPTPPSRRALGRRRVQSLEPPAPAETASQRGDTVETTDSMPAAPPSESVRSKPISPLQRLVEKDPLPQALDIALPKKWAAQPSGDSLPPAEPARPRLSETSTRVASQKTEAEQRGRSEAPLPTTLPLAEPYRISPNQFQPHRPSETDSAASAPAPAGKQVLAPIERQPLEPTARAELSPVVREPMPTQRPPQPIEAPLLSDAPQRIVERVTEVSVERPAPPRPMTAAGQSVIGALSQRVASVWQPRQEGL